MQNLSRLNHEERENLNRYVTSKEIVSGIKNLPTKVSSRLDGFNGEIHQAFKELTLILSSFPKKLK
jgi:hypothetical protein